VSAIGDDLESRQSCETRARPACSARLKAGDPAVLHLRILITY
jgi:hypothetical protein